MFQYFQVNHAAIHFKEIIKKFEILLFGNTKPGSWSVRNSLVLIACVENDSGVTIPKELFQYLSPLNNYNSGDGVLSIIGYKIGYYVSAEYYHSSKGGVLIDYRRQKVAKTLQMYTDNILKKVGVTKYTFNTFPNLYPEMFVFGLKYGYIPTSLKKGEFGIKLLFTKYFNETIHEIRMTNFSEVESYFKIPLNEIDKICKLIFESKLVGSKVSKEGIFLLFQ